MKRKWVRNVIIIAVAAVIVLAIVVGCIYSIAQHAAPGNSSGVEKLNSIPLGSHWQSAILDMDFEIYSDIPKGEGWLTWEDERIHCVIKFGMGENFMIKRFDEEYTGSNLINGSYEYNEELDEMVLDVFNWFGQYNSDITIILNVKEPTYVEVAGNGGLPIETEEDTNPKRFNNFLEAYLDILMGNSLLLTDPEYQEYQKDIAEGKVAILDIFGDETPELLYIYYSYEDIHESLKIFTYSETGETESVFDNLVYSAAGGGGNYCIYLTREGELMVYRSTFNLQYSYGFWPIIPNRNLEIVEDYGVYNYSGDLAKLYHVFVEGETVYMQNGEYISEGQHIRAAKETMGSIDHVIFQGTKSKEYGLYASDDLWKEIKPFEEECMTFDEAVAWLEASKEMGKQ